MNLHRDCYEGTEFDMTKGTAAGPFGFPYRYYGPYGGQGDVGDPSRVLEGAWERTLSVSYCGYVYVNQARKWLPDAVGGICWLGLDRPSETCFIPFFVGVSDLPPSVQNCNTAEFSFESSWWAFNTVSNYTEIKYSYMIEDIKTLRDSIETAEIEFVDSMDSLFRAGKRTDEITEKNTLYLTEKCFENTDLVTARWWKLLVYLIVRYDDGYINTEGHMAHEVGYPHWWLDQAGWRNGPTNYDKP